MMKYILLVYNMPERIVYRNNCCLIEIVQL